MMITVYGRATSSNVQTVMWAIAELGLAHERLDIGGAYGGNDTPEYRAMNPNGLVPTIRDGDLVMWESAAITRYLGARYGTETFWPTDPAERARLDMWAEWTKTTFYPVLISQIFVSLVRTPAKVRDMAALGRAADTMKGLAKMLDTRLARGPFLGGDELSFADIIVGHLLYRYHTLDFERADAPALAVYYDRLTARPAYQQHVMVSYAPLRHPEA